MPLTDLYTRLPLASIYVPRDERQRRKIDTKGLIESIKLRGVIQPIIVEKHTNPDGQHRLTAGERRYSASLELNLPDIPVRFAEDLTTIEASIYELEENIKRSDLPWQDLVVATERIHNLYRQEYPGWTQDDTTEALSLTGGTVSIYLKVASEISNPNVYSSATIREAYNLLTRRDARMEAQAVDWVLGTDNEPDYIHTQHPSTEPQADGDSGPAPPVHRLAPGAAHQPLILNPASSILQESFIHWAPKYSGRPFNLIHCDFPYGIGVFDGPQSGRSRHHEYIDTSELHLKLLECLLNNIDRLASSSCHILYWYSNQHYDVIRRAFAEMAPSFSIHTHPLIWVKSDNAGIAADPRHGPRHVYETCLLMTRGSRPIVRVVSDAYSAPTDKQWHIHTKPEPMLRHFMTMVADEHTSLLDPTCGSGTSLRAAESLGARNVLGMDIDEQTVGMARQALRHSRVLRSAAAHLTSV